MEIISYGNGSLAGKKGAFKGGFSSFFSTFKGSDEFFSRRHKRFSSVKNNSRSSSSKTLSLSAFSKSTLKRSFSCEKAFSFTRILKNIAGMFLLSLKKIRSMKEYFWIFPSLVFCLSCPFLALKALDYFQSYARPVKIDESGIAGLDFLDNIMLSFASEGNFNNTEDEESLFKGLSSDSKESFKDEVSWSTHIVKKGETIGGITSRAGLSNISTIIAVNKITNVRYLKAGQSLLIPSIDGIVHTVKKGETVNGISAKYSVPLEDILDVNDMSSDSLKAGTELFIPGAKMDSQALKKAMGELFISPISISYRLSSAFGPRKNPFTGLPASPHKGIDMACPSGTPIKASMEGLVVKTAKSNLYGNYVIMEHSEGYQTLYAHMSKITCHKGQRIAQGEKIGLVGSTGYSTGPHLHFTVLKNGKPVDPLPLIKNQKK